MEQSNQSKKVLLSVIGVAILVVAVVGVSFAFFNYTRTGAQNSVATGKINFSSTPGTGDDATIQIANFFPRATGEAANDNNSDQMTITISGATTYEAGLDYRLVVTDYVGTGSNANIPVKVEVQASTPLTTGGNTFVALPDANNNNQAATAPVLVSNGLILGEGHIAATATNAAYNLTTGVVTITGSIADTVAISDTYRAEGVNDDNGTTEAWRNGRDIVTTTEWNALAEHPITFKVRVESKQTGGNYAYSPS